MFSIHFIELIICQIHGRISANIAVDRMIFGEK